MSKPKDQVNKLETLHEKRAFLFIITNTATNNINILVKVL